MARSNVVTQEKYDDVKHLLKLDKFTQKEIANIVGMSNVTVYKIRISKDIEDYRAIVKKGLEKMRGNSAPKENPQTKFMASYAQMEKLNSQMKGLQESMDKANNTLNAIYDILKRYMEV